ncbi:MAG: hypothetical protein LBV30_01355 [Propionibacteriaceae bacterium]|jgi:hypothetical protein|nr:hypothetical protein [Propionibacteriaceae bacterium]
MSYKVIRVLGSSFRDRFQDTELDTDFPAKAYPDLDDFLSTMEMRGWSVVNCTASDNGGTALYLYVTLHRPDADSDQGPVEYAG